jgi:hypothetical protein
MAKDAKEGRRRLLALMGVTAAAGSAPASAFNADGSRGGIPAKPETEAEKRAPRYRETDHVRAFYRTNRS